MATTPRTRSIDKPALPADLTEALTAAEAALAERARLEQLQTNIVADLSKAEAARPMVTIRADDLETEIALAGDDVSPALRQQVEAAREAARTNAADIERLGRVKTGILPKLAAADAAIEAAHQAITATSGTAIDTARAAFEARLQEAAEGLAAVLRHGFALNALGIGVGLVLNDVVVPSSIGSRVLLQGNRLQGSAATAAVWLDQTWQDDATAAALFEAYRPMKQASERLTEHMARITRTRQMEATEAENRARADRINSRSYQYSTLPERAPSVPPVPPARFVPHSYATRTPGTPVPVETNVVAGFADDAEPMKYDGWAAAPRKAGD
jgi:hypothetical protein